MIPLDSIDRTTPAGKRTTERLPALKRQLTEQIPRRTLSETLLLATWNIREFDSAAYGERLDESFLYIAEIVSRFDLVAIQEVREDLKALDRLTALLGPWWRYIATDVTEGKPGNRERMAMLFDSRKVRFSGVSGEVVIPPVAVKVKGASGKTKTVYEPARQLSRTPFLAGFKAGWFRFMLCTVHVAYGEGKKDDAIRRVEIEEVARFLAKRADEAQAWSENMILLGDFNIFSPDDVTLTAITDQGFVVPEQLQGLPANAKKNRYYDQIAVRLREQRPVLDANSPAGVLDYFQSVYREEDEKLYTKDIGPAYRRTQQGKQRTAARKRTYYRTYWRTHQMSDHLPMWVELRIEDAAG
ncbi:MAG: endonuclease/exonuclease/phosphatase family protein [bacterium]